MNRKQNQTVKTLARIQGVAIPQKAQEGMPSTVAGAPPAPYPVR